MKIDRIIGKARMLGLSAGDADKSNELLNIATALGLSKDGHYDLDEVENSLDAMLEETNETTTTEETEDYEDEPLQHRNAMDKKPDSQKLSDESKNRTQEKVNEGSSKMNETENNEEDSSEADDSKEENKDDKENDDSSKEESENGTENEPKRKPFQLKRIKEGAKEGAKEAGTAVVNGAKNLIGFIIRHPLVAIVIGIVLIVIILVLMMLFDTEDFTDGYFDQTCDFNLTYVNYDCIGNEANVSIKDFVIGSAYAYSQDYEFSAGAYKALMIAIKTNTLAAGGYSSASKMVNATCPVRYQSVPSDAKKTLEKYYTSIERYLYVSSSHDGVITSLTGADTLNISDEYIAKIANSESGNYKSILREVYGGGRTSSSSSTSKIDTSKETIYIGDSRMNGMADYGIVDNAHVVYHGANGYCWFRYNTNYGSSCGVTWYRNATNDTNGIGAINLANQKMKSGQSYNIVIWLGVNDTGNLNNYFNVYKTLAEGEWSNHTIYIAQVGPVKEEIYTATYYRTNDEVIEFNNNMASLISGAGLSNLIYLDLGLTQDFINWDGTDGVHYIKSDYQKIFDLFQSTSGVSGNKTLYDLGSYCEFHKKQKGSGCEVGWWWPIGERGTFERGDVLTGDAEIVSVGNGLDFGWRYHPIQHVWKNHDGEDLEASMGRNVIAPKSGTVKTAIDGYVDYAGTGSCGNEIVIDHGDGFTTRYCHLKQGSVSKYVSEGMSVVQGQIIALSGNTGGSTGPHLHFEVRINNKPQNPLNYISTTNPRPGANGCVYNSDKSGICRALKDLGLSDNATAGILTNIAAEGKFKTNNLEDCYETNMCCKVKGKNYGYCIYGSYIGNFGNDAAYTAGVDNGTYQNFTVDHAGYGLIQWTDQGRKAELLQYYQNQKANGQANSIADTRLQISFMMYEINKNGYSGLRDLIYGGSASAYDIAYSFCANYEIPATSCSARANGSSSVLTYVRNNCSD